MRSKLSIWQVLLILIGIIAIVMITAYNPKYPSYPEASLYGAEPNGAMLITKLLDNRSIKYSIIGSKVEYWPDKSTVCIIESINIGDLYPYNLTNNQGFRTWLKQGGTFIVFGSGQFLYDNEIEEDGFFIEKKKMEHKTIDLMPIMPSDVQELETSNTPIDNIVSCFPFDISEKTLKITEENEYTKNVKSLHFKNAPYQIPNPNDTGLTTYIDMNSVNKGWDYLVGEYQFGDGKILLINSAQLIYNQSLTEADNAQFVLNVLSRNNSLVNFVDQSNTGDNNEGKIVNLIFFNPWGRLVLIAAVAIFVLRLDDLFYFVKPYSEPKSIRRSIMEYIRAQGWTYYRAQANTLAAQALVDGLKRKLMRAYCLPSMPSIQFIIRKLTEIVDANDYLKSNCQIVISMLHQTEISDKINSVELKILAETMQKLEPYLIKHFKY